MMGFLTSFHSIGMKLFLKQLLNKLVFGADNSLAHSLNNLVSIPTALLDESEAKAFSTNSISPEVSLTLFEIFLRYMRTF